MQNEEMKTKPGPNRRKVLTAVTSVALALAMILCVVVVCQVLSNGYVSVFGYSMFRVTTGSMEPELPVGTLLVANEVSISEIRVDDIVIFRSKSSDMLGAVITHRVINILENSNGQIFLETKGDANQYPDASYVEQKNLIGRVVYNTSSGNPVSELMSIITSPIGFFACIVFPCLVLGVLIMRNTIKNIRTEMENLSQELDAEENKDPLIKQMGTKEYQALCDRLRGELLEELKQSADLEEKTE